MTYKTDTPPPLDNPPFAQLIAIPEQRPITPFLDNIDDPSDLKALSLSELMTLANELRAYLLYSVGVSGGHLGANLGVVELSIALHLVFDTPTVPLLWDVGHQSYVHKILTGRREGLLKIRSKGGLSGFPERTESVYDAFGVGHSSTTISAGLGMSLALAYQHKPSKVVCVVGDGAMSAGMTFEAMNDAVQQNANLLVILNDNNMSISKATGGLAQHLSTLVRSGYKLDRDKARQPSIDTEEDIQNLFRAIGFDYFGCVDGHDLSQLVEILQRVERLNKPVLIHVRTVKGRGFLPAEQDALSYHAIAKLSADLSAKNLGVQDTRLSYSQVFGQFLCDKAEEDHKLIAITPAMVEGSGMREFSRRFADRLYDVAIAEQHAITLAGGMATQGIKPIVAIYSTFLQRGYDQLIHDVALQNLDVTFAIDRAGLVGEDGASHAGVFDCAFLRCLPNVIIACPKDENDSYHLLNTCYEYQGVSAVRYPRGKGVGVVIDKPFQRYNIGQSVIEFSHKSQTPYSDQQNRQYVAILAFGTMVQTATFVAKILIDDFDITIDVINMRWIKPLDTKMLDTLLKNGVSHMVTLEEHVVMGGAGSAVNEYLLNDCSRFNQQKLINIGIPDEYIAHATHQEQLLECALDVESVSQRIRQFIDPTAVKDAINSTF